ncbi:MAG: hypothetical protein Q9227_009287 [Pyrenula ochraceoflavens]
MQSDGARPISAAGSTASTIRPRNRRLISLNDDDESVFSGASGDSPFRSGSPSPFPSRGVSPIANARPPRSENANPGHEGYRRQNGIRQQPYSVNSPGPSLWGSSWSSIQGLASSLLGNETIQGGGKSSKNTISPWKSWTRNSTHDYHVQPSQPEWGPVSNNRPQLAAGTKEERRALVQAKKREVLLLANTHETPSAIRRYKRRDSDGDSPPRSKNHHDEDTYVYVHQVKPEDTIAGVTIKYDCRQDVFRKVNRFWPNDRIQIRQVVLLPVEACNVRGRKVSDATADLLSSSPLPQPEMRTPIASNSIQSSPKPFTNVDPPLQSPTSSVPPLDQEQSWTHSHWLHIDSFSDNVQVARMSRRALGFFPPARRKSISFSDLSQSPSASLDLGSRLHLDSANSSPPARRQRPSRHRSSSGSYFASRLHGIGGVGNLRGRSPAQPGPPQDSLNRVLGPHLPNLNPKSSFESITSEHSRVSSSTGLENVGGAIEGWMRKVAGRAATAWNEGQSIASDGRRDGGGRANWVSSGLGGDLIELDVAESPFAVGDDDDAKNETEETPRVERFAERRQVSTGRNQALDPDSSLRERVPSRGRSRDTDRAGGVKDD